jgi:hypothetical protein
MDGDEKIRRTEQEIESADEIAPSKEETAENYEVGYGKPPKNTRFKKGVSGNPSGRRKKPRDLDVELSSELNSPITIKDNGKRKRIPKVRGIVIQLANKALTGDIRAARIVLDHYQQAQDRRALSEAEEAKELERLDDLEELTDDELRWIAVGGDPKELLKRRKK